MPVINLEWIQKLHRDKSTRGYSAEAVTDTILRRMHDYVNYICPQFSRTHINFQRVPVVDTSDPFIARFIPTPDESFLVIRFAKPQGIDFPYLLSMLHGSFMSRANTIVCPGGKMDLAMQLIFTPMILRLIERRKEALARRRSAARAATHVPSLQLATAHVAGTCRDSSTASRPSRSISTARSSTRRPIWQRRPT